MPEADQDHGGVPLAVAVALGGLDQLLDLALGQVFAGPKLAVWAAGRRDCPFYCGWGHQLEARFCHMVQASRALTVRILYRKRTVVNDQGYINHGGRDPPLRERLERERVK